MNEIFFATIEDLKTQAIKDLACQDGLVWLEEQESLKEVIKEIPIDYRVWCLREGYFQFLDKCDFDKLDGYNWAWLLRKQPQFSDKCDFNKLDGNNWSWLLIEQPQFSDKCNFEKFDGYDLALLLRHQPQFSDKCNFDKLNGYNLAWLLEAQPQLSKYKLDD